MSATRRHDLDALRVLAFGLLILYHVGMLYVAEWEWHLKSGYQSEALQYLMLASNRWRMPILFLISGVALSLLAGKSSAGELLRTRTFRLLLPLVFGMLVVVPVQPYCQGVANGLVAPGFVDFILRYWTFEAWPQDAFDGWEYGFTWNHLWYLAYLWCYTVAALLLMPALRSRAGLAVQRFVTGLRGGALLLIPPLPKLVALVLLADAWPGTNDLFSDWYQHALYFSYFLLGWWLSTDAGMWAELERLRWTTLRLAVVSYVVFALLVKHLLDDDSAGAPLLGARVVSSLCTWLCIATVLGWSHTLLNRPFRWLPYANEAVISWYMLHQSLIVLVAYWVVPLKLGAWQEPLLLIAFTALGCGVMHEFVVRRSGVLRVLFGLKADQVGVRSPGSRAWPAPAQARERHL